ncbi:MAG: hypothetical protein Q4G55_00925 [bacterium]|nr:hypothetical protein [bacterium]
MKKAHQQIVSFSGVLEVVHALPGRMRLRMPSLRARARALAEFATSLKRLEGIQDVTVNPVLGTALVRYDAAKLTPSLVVAAATHGFDFETAVRNHQSLVGGELRALHYAFNQAIMQRTGGVLDLPALMTVLLIVTFVRGITGRGGPKVSPLAVLWWLHRSLSRL